MDLESGDKQRHAIEKALENSSRLDFRSSKHTLFK